MCPRLLHQCPLSPWDSRLIGSENKSPGPFLRATKHALPSGIMPTRITGRCVPLFLDQCWSFYHRIGRMDVNTICMEFVFMSTMRWLNHTKRTPCPSFRCDGISEMDDSQSRSPSWGVLSALLNLQHLPLLWVLSLSGFFLSLAPQSRSPFGR